MKLPLFSNVLRSGFVIRPYSSTLLCAPVMNKQSNSGILNLPTNSNFKTIYRLTRRFLLPWTSQVAGHKMAAIKSPLDKTYFSLHLCIIWWYFCSFPVSIIVFEKSSFTDYLVLKLIRFIGYIFVFFWWNFTSTLSFLLNLIHVSYVHSAYGIEEWSSWCEVSSET